MGSDRAACGRSLAAARVASLVGEATRAPGLLGAATEFHLAGGGGAWRAGLALDCAGVLGVAWEDGAALAAACELVHQASIVHDDAQDGDASRRERASVAARYGVPVAICVGDHLLAAGFAVLSEGDGTRGLVRLFAARVAEMAAGQAEEFSPALWREMTPGRALALARGKAGAAVALPVEGACVLAGLSAAEAAAAGEAGHALGVSYQVGDDVADLAADLARGASNSVVAQALHAAPAPARAALLDLLDRARGGGLAPGEAQAQAGRIAAHGPRAALGARALLDARMAELGEAGPGGRRLAGVLARAAAALGARGHEAGAHKGGQSHAA